MPISLQAKKKLRHDRKTTVKNAQIKKNIRDAVKEMRQKPSVKLFTKVESILDKASKINVVHKNKTARLKSRLSKLIKSGK